MSKVKLDEIFDGFGRINGAKLKAYLKEKCEDKEVEAAIVKLVDQSLEKKVEVITEPEEDELELDDDLKEIMTVIEEDE